MTPLHKSRRLESIDKLGKKPPIRPGNTPPDKRCPLLGEPLEWLKKSNIKVRIMEMPKGLKR
jgi:hypothetical protein